MKLYKYIAGLSMLAILLSSCDKYEEIADAEHLEQRIFMPTGVLGVYNINQVAVPGQVYRYIITPESNKFTVPLTVFRSGIDSKGPIRVQVSANPDTVNKLIPIPDRLPSGTELLPANRSGLPETVTIPDGEDFAKFDLVIDLNYLLANPTKKFATGVKVASNDRKSGKNTTTIVAIDPAFLVPAANFTTSTDATNARRRTFNNTSANGVSFTWNFGDNSPTVTERSPSHTYTAAGTYTVTLTTVGAAGDVNKSVKTAQVTVL